MFSAFHFNTLFAQIEVSIGGGLNVSSARIFKTNIFVPEYRNGYYLSLTPQLSLNKNFKLTAEGQFSQEGFQVERHSRLKYSYLYFRLIPQIEFTLLNVVGFYSGISAGIKVEESLKVGNSDNSRETDEFKDYDFSIPMGMRIYIGRFRINLSYNLGVSNIKTISLRYSTGHLIKEAKLTNSHFQIGMGYNL